MPKNQPNRTRSGSFRESLKHISKQCKRNFGLCFALAPLLYCAVGCSGPKTIVRYNSPYDGVYYTVETMHGKGAIDDDFSSVYANLQMGSKTQREEILNGEYLEDTKVSWTSPDDVVLCMEGGYTETFRNVTLLSSGSVTRSLHNHLREDCKTR